MIESNIKKEVEEKIDDYVQGKLSAEEIDELWAELIQDDYYLDYLKTVAALKKIAEREEEKKSRILPLQNAQKWVAAAAAILLIAGSLFVFNLSVQPGETVQPVASIELDYYRSADGVVAPDAEIFDGIREAIMEANQGNIEGAVELIDSKIAEVDSPAEIAELNITAGSILYNNGMYEQALDRFRESSRQNVDDVLVKERTYWYLGNTYFQLNKLDEAKDAFQNAYDQNGAYSRVAQSYIKALSAS